MKHLFNDFCESALISCLMQDPQNILLIGKIDSEDFYDKRNKFLFDFISKNSERDVHFINQTLVRHPNQNSFGGFEYLNHISSHPFSKNNLLVYEECIFDLSRKRNLLTNLSEIVEKLKSPKDETSIEEINIMLEAACISKIADETPKMETLDECFSEMIEYWNHKSDEESAKCGLGAIDHFIKGFKKSELTLIAARASLGKTTLAINMATNMASENNIMFFSIEISRNQLFSKITSNLTQIHFDKFNTGLFDEAEAQKIFNLKEDSKSIIKNIFCQAHSNLTIGKIKNQIKLHIAKHKKSPIVFVDYLQLIKPSGNYKKDRHLQIGEISWGLKEIAKEFNTQVIALCQLNRDVEKRANKKPMMSDLRESGSLEQDADIIIFLYRLEENRDLVEVMVAKNRNGMCGESRLLFNPSINRFMNTL